MNIDFSKVLVTGSVGFIGYSLCKKLLDRGSTIIGIDNHNSYYDPRIKDSRHINLKKYINYIHYRGDICNKVLLDQIFESHKPEVVVNLAAQAGVRYSLQDPLSYINSNILGFGNLLESCRFFNIKNLVYASTSSVYGANGKIPYSENDSANHPLSVYSASKKSNELMAHAYSHLFNLSTTGLRFFTVYGPWGRPDMALFKFTKAIIEEKSIEVYNEGNHSRDFTYIDDIVNGIIKVIYNPAESNPNWDSINPDPATSRAPWKIYNIGNNKSIKLMDYISLLEETIGKKAKIKFLPMQPGDVPNTNANIDNLSKKFDYKPQTSVSDGIANFVNWYKSYYCK